MVKECLLLISFFFVLSNAMFIKEPSVKQLDDSNAPDYYSPVQMMSLAKSDVKWQEFEMNFADIQFRFNMSKPLKKNVCETVNVFVFITIRPSSFAVRSAIRDSYAKQMVIVLFVSKR